MPIRKKKHIKKKKTFGSISIPKRSPIIRVKPENTHEVSDQPNTSLLNQRPINRYYCDSGAGIKGFYSPFNRFAGSTSRPQEKHLFKKMIYERGLSGLSQKEKSYVISKCQSRSTRYAKLKNLAADAIQNGKIFSIYGNNCNTVRKALEERGWVEKISQNKMNLSKIINGTIPKTEVHYELERLLVSNLVEKYAANFEWRTRDEHLHTNTSAIDMNKEMNITIVNKLKVDAQWTSKQGLCSSMKRNYWFYIEDVAEVDGPRSYNSYDAGEKEGFAKDYKITACTSLLKWILSKVANGRPVFVDGGTISLNVVVFALNRCKEYLFRKQNKDIDRTISGASPRQWDAFLRKYYRIIEKDSFFQEDTENRLPLYLGYAKFMLNEIYRYRPQLSCEGCHNIWIIKPAQCSRGRGIRLASKLGVITGLLNKANAKHVIQKYIEEPLLIHDTKFDIRQYYLVTSTYPLVIWMYRDCYLKFSSQKYNLKNYHESIHLTNNAVQRRYANCIGRHAELPENNMWDLDEYKNYLNRIGKEKVWDNIVYPGMKKSIIGIMLSCQDSLSACKNRFELYGCDFILDNRFKPWLIEINSCPDLRHTTNVTAKICPAVVADIIKVVIDYPCNTNSSTGKFECVYSQLMSPIRYGAATDFMVRGFALPLDYFYRGEIKLTGSYDDADIVKQRDLQVVLNKLKLYYDQIEPEDDYDSKKKPEQRTCVHHTESEYGQSVDTTDDITRQLEELMDRMSSEHSCISVLSLLKQDSLLVDSAKSMSPKQSVKSDTKSLPKNTCSRFTSTEVLSHYLSFEFSDLDDGPLGKGSSVDIQNVKVSPDLSRGIHHKSQDRISSKRKLQFNMEQAQSNIISFLNQKEKEYYNRRHIRG